jgi:hypothetical protein
MEKISYADLKAMIMNPDTPGTEIGKYLRKDPRKTKKGGPLDPQLVPDPAKVDMTREAEFEVESAMRWGNSVERWRREQRFNARIAHGERKPVLVSEGDSWFQFPFLIEDVIDQLEPNFIIRSLDAAGDTCDNMVNRSKEYFSELKAQIGNGVAGFLFSGAGNDVIGEDLDGNPVLGRLLKPYRAGADASWHVDKAVLAQILSTLEKDYRKVVATIRHDEHFKRLPIIIHGYDYAIPGGFAGDPRNPFPYAAQDEWLGAPMRQKGIVEPGLQRAIIRVLIDALYDMLDRVAGDSAQTRVFVVNVRETLPHVNDWADEIHGTSKGFARVAKRFKAVLDHAL